MTITHNYNEYTIQWTLTGKMYKYAILTNVRTGHRISAKFSNTGVIIKTVRI